MRQILVLEEWEVSLLQKGKTLVLNTGAGEVQLQFSRNGNGKDGKEFRCDICGATSGATGVAFDSMESVARHKGKKHPHTSGKGRA